jgi:hypothetical protein
MLYKCVPQKKPKFIVKDPEISSPQTPKSAPKVILKYLSHASYKRRKNQKYEVAVNSSMDHKISDLSSKQSQTLTGKVTELITNHWPINMVL